VTQETFPEIREAVRKLCARFPGAYWRELDRERAYPTEFVQALTEWDRVLHDGECTLGALAPLPATRRAGFPCLEAGRADLIIPGIAICLATMARFGVSSIRVSDAGLREGILVDHLARSAP